MTKERIINILKNRRTNISESKVRRVHVVFSTVTEDTPYLVEVSDFTPKEWGQLHSGLSVPIDWDVLGNETAWVHLWDARVLDILFKEGN